MSLLVALSVGALTLMLGLAAAVLAEVMQDYVRGVKIWLRARSRPARPACDPQHPSIPALTTCEAER